MSAASEQQNTMNQTNSDVKSEGYSLYDSEVSKTETEKANASETLENDKEAFKKAEDVEKEEGDESDQDESTDDESDQDESEEKDEQKPKKKSGFKKRIERFQKRLSEKEQELAHWKSEALKNNAESKKQGPSKTEQSTDLSKKPKADDFDTHEEYVEALTDWKLEQKEVERERLAKEKSAKDDYQKQVESFQSKVKDFEKDHDDFQDVMSEVDDIPLSFSLQDAILTSDIGPAIMYELAKNREELERISALGPVQAAREIGKIEARLSSIQKQETAQKTKTKTKAPPPISPLSGSNSGSLQKRPDEMSGDEYLKWRKQNRS